MYTHIDRYIYMYVCEQDGSTAFELAASKGHCDVVSKLLASGVPVDSFMKGSPHAHAASAFAHPALPALQNYHSLITWLVNQSG